MARTFDNGLSTTKVQRIFGGLFYKNNLSSSEGYSELCRKYKMELFAKLVKGWKPLTIFAKSFILDVWQGSEYDPNHDLLSSLFLNPQNGYIKRKPITYKSCVTWLLTTNSDSIFFL